MQFAAFRGAWRRGLGVEQSRADGRSETLQIAQPPIHSWLVLFGLMDARAAEGEKVRTSLRVTFSDEACMICLVAFSELIGEDKITFGGCQHTICRPCLSKHAKRDVDGSKVTPCCKQPIGFAIHTEGEVHTGIFYKFTVENIIGEYLFRFHRSRGLAPGELGEDLLLTCNEDMLVFNSKAPYEESVARPYLALKSDWQQVYFQLPTHSDDDDDCVEPTMHWVVVRIRGGKVEFRWDNPKIKIEQAKMEGAVSLPTN